MDVEAVREAVDPLVTQNVPSAALFPDLAVPADVEAYLTAQGFTAHGAPAMGVDIASLTATTLPEGYELVRIGDGLDGEEWVRAFAAGLGYRVGVLQSSEAGHRVYRALGFANFGAVPLYVRIPG